MENKRPNLEAFKEACKGVSNPHLVIIEFLETINYAIDQERRALVAEKTNELFAKNIYENDFSGIYVNPEVIIDDFLQNAIAVLREEGIEIES